MEEAGDIPTYATVRAYVTAALEGFLLDPPDSPYQRGYMEALATVYQDALGMPKGDPLLIAVAKLAE